MILVGQDLEVAEWVASNIPHVREFEPWSTAIGVLDRKGINLIAGMVYHDYQPEAGTIQLSMAAITPMWARKNVIHQLLAYPFEDVGVYKVWTATPAHNSAALKVNKKVGMKQEAILGHHFGHKTHCVINRMLLPDYERIYGRLSRKAAEA